MNYTEYVWNIYVSRPFLKSQKLRLQLSAEDLLNGRNRNWYTVSAYSNTYDHYDFVGSLVMLTLRYSI